MGSDFFLFIDCMLAAVFFFFLGRLIGFYIDSARSLSCSLIARGLIRSRCGEKVEESREKNTKRSRVSRIILLGLCDYCGSLILSGD